MVLAFFPVAQDVVWVQKVAGHGPFVGELLVRRVVLFHDNCTLLVNAVLWPWVHILDCLVVVNPCVDALLPHLQQTHKEVGKQIVLGTVGEADKLHQWPHASAGQMQVLMVGGPACHCKATHGGQSVSMVSASILNSFC
jgi:hypothetical protein